MEERTIKVSLTKAKEWYGSGNPTLKELALQAFNKEELEIPEVKEIIETLSKRYGLTTTQYSQLHSLKGRQINKISAPKLLRILAEYFNNQWRKEIGNVGYFLTKKEFNYSTYAKYDTLGNDWIIIKHESVNYPLTYFRTEEDCKKAFQIMKSLGKLDDLYLDF